MKIFSTEIYHSELKRRGGESLRRELETESFQIQEFDVEGREWSKKNYVGGYTSYASMDTLHTFSSTFSSLKIEIDSHVGRYLEKLRLSCSVEDLEMIDCWVNIMPAGVAHSGHIHPLSVISGTYYVTSPAKSAPIQFEDPRLPLFMNRPAPQFSSYVKKIKPRQGELVLFESWLRHEVPAGRNTQERVSVSFNYNWK